MAVHPPYCPAQQGGGEGAATIDTWTGNKLRVQYHRESEAFDLPNQCTVNLTWLLKTDNFFWGGRKCFFGGEMFFLGGGNVFDFAKIFAILVFLANVL